jgi:hypothetical protein
MISHQLHEAFHQAVAEVPLRLESGELDGSGRYYSNEELAAGAALEGKRPAAKAAKASAG